MDKVSTSVRVNVVQRLFNTYLNNNIELETPCMLASV